jgi:hypothetical protein
VKTEYKITEENGKFVVKSHVTNPSLKFLDETYEHTFVNFVAECDTLEDAKKCIDLVILTYGVPK